MRSMRCVLCCVLLIIRVYAAEEGSEHMDSHYDDDGEHNVEYDHEAILGSRDLNKQYANLSPQEAKIRLDGIIKKIDTDADGSVTKEELSAWIIKSFKKLDEEDAQYKLTEQDHDEDGNVSWKEYLKAVYGFTPQEVKEENPKITKIRRSDKGRCSQV